MKNPKFNYDEKSDVMYISFGEPESCRSVDTEPGIVIRYNLTGELNGITIIDYKKRTDKKKK